jgi:hypothetical protein
LKSVIAQLYVPQYPISPLGPGAKKQSGAHPLGEIIHSTVSRERCGFQDVIGDFIREGRVFGLIVSHVVHNNLKFIMTSIGFVSDNFYKLRFKTPRAAERTNRPIPAEESRFIRAILL